MFHKKVETSLGRVEKAENIVINTAYLMLVIKNKIDEQRYFTAMKEKFDASTYRQQRRDLKKGFDTLSDLKIFQVGIYELLVGRYEILCTKKGIVNEANTTFIESYQHDPFGITQ